MAESPTARSPGSESGYAKSRDTRARILAAAMDEAHESGFHKTSVARIAARAGVAIGSLNYHFGSRGDLIHELMRLLMVDLMARVHEAEAKSGHDFFARERAVLLAYIDHAREHPEYVRLADEIKLHEPKLYEHGSSLWLGRMAERLRSGIEEGSLRPMDESEIFLQAHFLLGARHFLEQLLENDTGMSEEEIVDSYLSLLRNGLGQPAKKASKRSTARRRSTNKSTSAKKRGERR